MKRIVFLHQFTDGYVYTSDKRYMQRDFFIKQVKAHGRYLGYQVQVYGLYGGLALKVEI